MKKIITTSLLIFSSFSFAEKQYEYNSGNYKNHLIETYISDNCSNNCFETISKPYNKAYNQNYIMENIFPINVHTKLLDNRHFQSEYRNLVPDERYSQLIKMNKSSKKIPQFFFNNKELPRVFYTNLDFRKLITDKLVGNLGVVIENNTLKAIYEPVIFHVRQPTVFDGFEDKPITEIISDNNYDKNNHTLHISLVTKDHHRYIPKGINESKIKQDHFSLLAYGSSKSNDLNWNVKFPSLTHLEFDNLAVIVWVENSNNEIIQVTGGNIYRDYY